MATARYSLAGRPGEVARDLLRRASDSVKNLVGAGAARWPLASGCGLVEGHGGANESLQRLLVYLLALVEVDGTPCVPVKTGVEEARRILQSRPFREGHLHDVLVSLACADHSVVLPHRNPSPLPLLTTSGSASLTKARSR